MHTEVDMEARQTLGDGQLLGPLQGCHHGNTLAIVVNLHYVVDVVFKVPHPQLAVLHQGHHDSVQYGTVPCSLCVETGNLNYGIPYTENAFIIMFIYLLFPLMTPVPLPVPLYLPSSLCSFLSIPSSLFPRYLLPSLPFLSPPSSPFFPTLLPLPSPPSSLPFLPLLSFPPLLPLLPYLPSPSSPPPLSFLPSSLTFLPPLSSSLSFPPLPSPPSLPPSHLLLPPLSSSLPSPPSPISPPPAFY